MALMLSISMTRCYDTPVKTAPRDIWKQATFEAAEEAMLAEGARLSLEEKLLWIQEINRFAALLKPLAAAPGPAGRTRD